MSGGRDTELADLFLEIGESAKEFDWASVSRQSREYAGVLHTTSRLDPTTGKVLKLLLQNRQYSAVMDVADIALAIDPSYRTGWRLYAQALVDGGRTAPALRIYSDQAADLDAPAFDRAEALGGVGRCYKQLYLAEIDPDRRAGYLHNALNAYGDLFRDDPESYWHGINTVALLAHANRSAVSVAGIADLGQASRQAAAAVLREAQKDPDAWKMATACEAFIALDDEGQALRCAREFVLHKETDAFMLAALLRQLEQVWKLDPDSFLGTRLLPQLRSELVRKNGGGVIVNSADVTANRIEMLEKVYGADRFQTLSWWRTGLLRCRAVVRIDDLYGVGLGTGFLVKGSDLHPELPPVVVVTNGHVIPEALDHDDALVAFHGLDGDDLEAKKIRAKVKRRWWYSRSSPPGVDTTLLELDAVPDGVSPMPLAKKLPVFNESSRTYIIGHPKGYEQPQFSIQDNLLLDHDDTYLHYRSPTEGGSSGSPVFDGRWNVIGLHHAGDFTMPRLNGAKGTYAANEALHIDAIRSAISQDPTAGRGAG